MKRNNMTEKKNRMNMRVLRKNKSSNTSHLDEILYFKKERMAAEAEAKQLDSVTDVVKETEIDSGKAQQAIGLITAKRENDHKAAALAAVAVSKEDVALIVSELEVTEEVAERVLREVSLEAKEGNVVEAALRMLIA